MNDNVRCKCRHTYRGHEYVYDEVIRLEPRCIVKKAIMCISCVGDLNIIWDSICLEFRPDNISIIEEAYDKTQK